MGRPDSEERWGGAGWSKSGWIRSISPKSISVADCSADTRAAGRSKSSRSSAIGAAGSGAKLVGSKSIRSLSASGGSGAENDVVSSPSRRLPPSIAPLLRSNSSARVTPSSTAGSSTGVSRMSAMSSGAAALGRAGIGADEMIGVACASTTVAGGRTSSTSPVSITMRPSVARLAAWEERFCGVLSLRSRNTRSAAERLGASPSSRGSALGSIAFMRSTVARASAVRPSCE